MRKIREVLRLKFEGLSDRQIAHAIGSARSTVQECLRRAREASLLWPLAPELDEATLHDRLYRREVPLSSNPVPDFALIHAELQRRGVTRQLLWEEYKSAHPDGWQYSAFCAHYTRWLSTQDVVLRQQHTPGDKLFVDYAGQTAEVVDRHSGEIRVAQIFVAVLGASSYTFAEATWSQTLPDWLGSHVRAFEFFGGCPRALVPDNLKSGVTRANRYEPELNPAYQDLAEHYGLAVLPARVRKPRDKAKVEVGVQVVERWILARLRDRRFFSLAELNEAIASLLADINRRPFKRREGSRESLFHQVEHAALRPLPEHRYEFATWKKAKVHLDYHVEIERSYYSVPYALIGQSIDVRLSARMVELFHRQRLVATHLRAARRGCFVTTEAHRPPRHAAVIELTQERLMQRALAVGPATAEVLTQQLHRRTHPEEALRASLGILRLAQDFSAAALEQAAHRALELRSYSYRAVRALIRTDANASAAGSAEVPTIEHENLRGSGYFR